MKIYMDENVPQKVASRVRFSFRRRIGYTSPIEQVVVAPDATAVLKLLRSEAKL